MEKVKKYLEKNIVASAFVVIFVGAVVVMIIEGIGSIVLGSVILALSFIWSMKWYILFVIILVYVIRYLIRLEKILNKILDKEDKN